MGYDAYVELSEGTVPLAEFNSALLVSIPKGGSLLGTHGYEGKASQLRPWTLGNSCRKLITRAFGAALKNIAMQVANLAQRGFVRGHKMLANVIEAQLALEEAVICGMGPSALVLFNVAAAFPSAEWEWIWRCLEVVGVPAWLADGLRATYDSTDMTIMYDGTVFAEMIVSLRRGIKQGCPTSGALWSLLFGPIVHRLVSVLQPIGYSLTVFADDLATALETLCSGCGHCCRCS